MRVILEQSLWKKSAISHTPSREFMCGNLIFSTFDHAPVQLIELASTAIKQGQTAAIIPEVCLRPQGIFFDMDATVIREESLVEIAKAAGLEQEIELLTRDAMAGQMDFKESLKRRLQILKGVPRSTITAISPTLSLGMVELTTWCRDHGIPIFLVSGGFVEISNPIAHALGFKDVRANRFAWDGDRLSGEVDGEIIDAQAKRNVVLLWCQTHKLDPRACIAVGDGANDHPMMQVCGLAIGHQPKQALWPHLGVANHTGDHRFIKIALS